MPANTRTLRAEIKITAPLREVIQAIVRRPSCIRPLGFGKLLVRQQSVLRALGQSEAQPLIAYNCVLVYFADLTLGVDHVCLSVIISFVCRIADHVRSEFARSRTGNSDMGLRCRR